MAQSTTNIVQSPFVNQPGLVSPQLTSTPTTAGTAGTGGQTLGIASGSGTSTPVPSGVNIAATGGVTTANKPVSSSVSAPQSVYQQNLSKYGLTSIPAGYSFDASGKLTNGLGQEYATTQSTTTNNTGSASGGLVTPPVTSQTQGQTDPYTNTGAPSYSGLVGSLASTAAQPSQAFTQAQGTAQDALTQLEASRTNEANALALNSENPIPLEFQQGRGQVLQNQYLGQQDALSNEYNGAVGLENAATGQQGTQQSGLAGAAGLAAPQQVSPTNVPYSPTTGQYGTPAASAYGSGTSNGLQSIGNISGQIGVGQNVTQLNSQLGGAQVVGQNLQNLISQQNINPSGLSVVNGALQFGANQAGNPAYQEFQGQVNDFINSIAPILGGASGATTDYKTQLAGQVVNALASGQSINQVISYFLSQAQQKIQGLSTGGGVNSAISTQQNSAPTFGSFF